VQDTFPTICSRPDLWYYNLINPHLTERDTLSSTRTLQLCDFELCESLPVPCTKSTTEQFNKQDNILIRDMSYATIISTDTVHALIDTIITLDKNIIDYIMKY
jgi:hypothetical protein